MDETKQRYKIPNQQQHLERWFSRGVQDEDLRYFLTLTFVDDVKETTAKRTMREFLKRLNIQCFGRRYKKDSVYEVKCISVIEQNKSRTTNHFHLLVSDPSVVSNRQQAHDFKSTIYRIWKSLKLTGKNHLDKNDKWFREIDTSEGIASYLAKDEPFSGTDIFDVENSNVPYR